MFKNITLVIVFVCYYYVIVELFPKLWFIILSMFYNTFCVIRKIVDREIMINITVNQQRAVTWILSVWTFINSTHRKVISMSQTLLQTNFHVSIFIFITLVSTYKYTVVAKIYINFPRKCSKIYQTKLYFSIDLKDFAPGNRCSLRKYSCSLERRDYLSEK